MPGGKIPLDMLINYNAGVKQLLSASSAAEKMSIDWENFQFRLNEKRLSLPYFRKGAPFGDPRIYQKIANRETKNYVFCVKK